jgi:hypothetical protein
MTEAERAELVELLLKPERDFMQEIKGVNEQQWSFKLRPDRWSLARWWSISCSPTAYCSTPRRRA